MAIIINRAGNGFKFLSGVNRTNSLTNANLNFNPKTQSFTITATFKIDSIFSTATTILSNGGISGMGYYIDVYKAGGLAIYFWNGTTGFNSIVSANGVMDLIGSMVTLVWSYTTTGSYLYVGPALATSAYSAYTGTYSAVNQFYLAWRPSGGNTYAETITYYNLGIFNRALTQAEGMKLVQSDGAKKFATADYLGLYDFEHTTGATIENKIGVLPNLTIQGAMSDIQWEAAA